jgi:hypothetical protein
VGQQAKPRRRGGERTSSAQSRCANAVAPDGKGRRDPSFLLREGEARGLVAPTSADFTMDMAAGSRSTPLVRTCRKARPQLRAIRCGARRER